MRLSKVALQDAVGMLLPHDITKIVPGKYKGARFRKGHVVTRADIPELLKLGKEHLWVLRLAATELHEDDAARAFAKLAGKHVGVRGPREGKLTFSAQVDGLLRVSAPAVARINRVPDVVFATRHDAVPVRAGEEVAGIRIVPLATTKARVRRALRAAAVPPLQVLPFRKLKVGLVVTGSEVAKGRIRDRFRPVIEQKMRAHGSRVTTAAVVTDDRALIAAAVRRALRRCDLVIVTGGMSVDPDDVTRHAIRDAGAKLERYGIPVLPGNMLLLAYAGKKPVVGVPACGIFHMTTSFDLVLPRLLAGLRVTSAEMQDMGYGGYCLHCRRCVYPACPLGKR
jgi:molybdenum cofactor synthesis domain-containing protein